MKAEQVTLIQTDLTVRGGGTSSGIPSRIVRQWWTPDGNLVAEKDPCATPLTPEVKADILLRIEDRFASKQDALRISDIVLEILNIHLP